jgi:hypothetical protein
MPPQRLIVHDPAGAISRRKIIANATLRPAPTPPSRSIAKYGGVGCLGSTGSVNLFSQNQHRPITTSLVVRE